MASVLRQKWPGSMKSKSTDSDPADPASQNKPPGGGGGPGARLHHLSQLRKWLSRQGEVNEVRKPVLQTRTPFNHKISGKRHGNTASRGMKQYNYGSSGMGQNNHGSSGMGQYDYGSSGMGQDNFGSSGMGQHDYGSSGMGQYDYGSSGMGPYNYGMGPYPGMKLPTCCMADFRYNQDIKGYKQQRKAANAATRSRYQR